MKTAEKSAKAKPEPVADTAHTYVVLSDLVWHGKVHKPGSKVTFAKQGSHVNRERWLKAKRIRPLNAKEAAEVAAAPSTKTPEARKGSQSENGKALPDMVGKFELIPHTQIDRSPFNPRKDFTSEGAKVYLTSLAQSIRERGIIEPLIVRPVGKNGNFELVAGECRWRAAKLADVVELPCIVRPYDKLGAILAQAVENLQRRDINPMEEAEGYKMLMREGKYTVPDIVRETGKSEASIYARLKLLECPPGIRKAVEENRLPATTAELVARVPVEHRAKTMDAILFPGKNQPDGEDPGGVLSFRQAKAWVEQNAPKFTAEEKWEKTVKGHHLFTVAVRTIGPLESGDILFSGGWLRSNDYVKPGDTCYEDPERRSWEALAKLVGDAFTQPILVADPGDFSKVVVVYQKRAAINSVRGVIPDPEEFARRQKEREAEREKAYAAAEEKREGERQERKVGEARRAAEIVVLVQACETRAFDETTEHMFLENVLLAFVQYELDCGAGVIETVFERRGLYTEAEEEKGDFEDVWKAEQIVALLKKCTTGGLRGWLLELLLTGLNGQWSGNFADERHADAIALLLPEHVKADATADVCGSSEEAGTPEEAVVA